MKWPILLILLASCGKDTQPAFKDLSDLDGDQISNFDEERLGQDKYFANVSKITTISGTMAFEEGGSVKKKYQFNFSNERNLESDSIKILVQNLSLLPSEDYFQEWQKINIKNISKDITFENEKYNLHLEFSPMDKTPKTLVFQGVSVSKVLAPWSSQMKVSVTKQELMELLNAKAYLIATVMPSFSETIKSSTYRVLFSDQKESKVIYVSNRLSRDALLEKLGVKSPRTIDPKEILNTANTTGEWWVREISDKDLVIVKTTFESLKKTYMKNFTSKTEEIKRVNGVAGNIVQIRKNPESMVYLKIRLSKTKNSFIEGSRTEENCSGRQCENFSRCNLKIRTHQNENSQETTKNDLVTQVQFSPIKGQSSIYENVDEKGRFFEVIINSPESVIELGLQSLPANSYVTTGVYNWNCDDNSRPKADLKTSQVNYEGKFSINIEAFVEKI